MGEAGFITARLIDLRRIHKTRNQRKQKEKPKKKDIACLTVEGSVEPDRGNAPRDEVGSRWRGGHYGRRRDCPVANSKKRGQSRGRRRRGQSREAVDEGGSWDDEFQGR